MEGARGEPPILPAHAELERGLRAALPDEEAGEAAGPKPAAHAVAQRALPPDGAARDEPCTEGRVRVVDCTGVAVEDGLAE